MKSIPPSCYVPYYTYTINTFFLRHKTSRLVWSAYHQHDMDFKRSQSVQYSKHPTNNSTNVHLLPWYKASHHFIYFSFYLITAIPPIHFFYNTKLQGWYGWHTTNTIYGFQRISKCIIFQASHQLFNKCAFTAVV